jgi:hypothetical protein
LPGFPASTTFRTLAGTLGFTPQTLNRMHRALFVLAALLLAPGALAQEYAIDKGSYLFGGTASFSSQGSTIEVDGFGEQEADRLTEIVYNVSFAYFVVPGLAIGGDSQYRRRSEGDVTGTVTSVGPSLAYFFGTPTSKAYPFLTASAGLSTVSVEIDGDSGSSNGLRFGFAGGLSYMIARNVALTGALFYQNESFDDDGVSVTDEAFGFQGGVTAFIF